MRSSIVAAAISLFMAGAAFGSEAHGASRKQMHIPAQQLGTALQILASDYDLQLIYVYEEVRDVHTGGAVGELGFDEALKSLLQGTGLTFRYLDEKTVTITPVNGKATGGYPSTPASQSRADVALVRTDYVVNVDAAEEPRKKMALAQAATPAPAQTAPFEEVMVTARRRNEHVQDIPVAVTAISGEELTQRSVVVMHDVAAGVPNLTISTGQRSSMGINISLRGQSTTTPATNFDNAIGIYYDGVYLARTFATMATVMDIQSVEVDRGVQGTLSGRNTTGGAIRFETNKPQLGEYEAVVSGTAGNEGVYRGGAIVNIPLGDTLAMRFNYMVMSRDDLGRSVSTGAGCSDFSGSKNRPTWATIYKSYRSARRALQLRTLLARHSCMASTRLRANG